jgi:hypothetical protein
MVGQSEAVILVLGSCGDHCIIYRPMPKYELKLIFTQLEGCCTLFVVHCILGRVFTAADGPTLILILIHPILEECSAPTRPLFTQPMYFHVGPTF